MKNDKQVLQNLTTDEKFLLTTGDGSWQTASIPRLGVPSVVVADGPVGLRKEVVSQGVKHTLPAVAFPSVSKLACSFDPAVLHDVGAAIGAQCRAQNVNVLLAPGLNIKRNPLCGRNFEYFSEDPLLTAELANGYISGVHSQKVGVCVKHFAGNSQEYARRVSDSLIDERALREIYLSAFEKVIKQSRPCAVMCAYNKLNGEYCSQNRRLLTEILRNEWGFDGVVMSDWGATDDRPKGISSGLDLQMPQGDLEPVRRAFAAGTLWESDLDASASRVLALAAKFADFVEKDDNFDENGENLSKNGENPVETGKVLSKTVETSSSKFDVDFDAQHEFCRKLAADCTVLVKNNCNLLPFSKDDTVALIGDLAEAPYFQGGGSSQVVPYKLETLKDGFAQLGVQFRFARAYTRDGTDETLLAEARQAASECAKVVLVVGDIGSEHEGADRTSLSLPSWQLQAIDAVTSVNGQVAIVVQSGAPVDVSWHHSCKALILDYLSGENGTGLADVLFGLVHPTGRLAETWPYALPRFAQDYGVGHKRALYKESIFVGYRYYNTANVEVAFPFGYGLSYNNFRWNNIKISPESMLPVGKFNVTLEVENCDKKEDADTVQIYLTDVDGKNFRAKRKLVAFKKVKLKGREKKKISIPVDVADFAAYDALKGEFVVHGGRYILTVARHCEDAGTPLTVEILGANNSQNNTENFPFYYNIDGDFCPTDEQFSALFGAFPEEQTRPFSRNSALADIAQTKVGKLLAKALTKDLADKHNLMALPLIDFVHVRPNLSVEMVDTLVEMLNGNFFKNLFRLLWQWWKCWRHNQKQRKTLEQATARQQPAEDAQQ